MVWMRALMPQTAHNGNAYRRIAAMLRRFEPFRAHRRDSARPTTRDARGPVY
jgi:hypothetical protein